jgi:hypothetical protein
LEIVSVASSVIAEPLQERIVVRGSMQVVEAESVVGLVKGF